MAKSLLDFPLYNKGVSAALSEKEEGDERATCAFKNPPPSKFTISPWPLVVGFFICPYSAVELVEAATFHFSLWLLAVGFLPCIQFLFL